MTEPLGLQVVHRLATTDLYVEGDELKHLATDVALLRSRLDLFPGQEDYWRVRLQNVQRAIEVAADCSDGQGGVYIG